MGRTLHLILNPKAGSGKAARAGHLLVRHCRNSGLQPVLHQTEHAGHATEIASTLRNSGELVLAVGGDGTVSEIAAGLHGGSAVLGIIPCGSGNGLARHLGIPQQPVAALDCQLNGNTQQADVMFAGDRLFFNIAGIGFDGSVAADFNAGTRRGLLNYIRLIATGFFSASEFNCTINGPGVSYEGPAFILAFANGSQYGNNAQIASGASLNDGKMELVIVRKPNLLQVPLFTWQVMTGRTRKSGLVRFYSVTALHVAADKAVHLHLDGEAAGQVSSLDLRVEAGTLNLVVPSRS